MFVDVRSAPLVDRLVVVADDHEVGRSVRLGEELDQALLRRVHVLVLVDDEVPQVRRYPLAHRRVPQGPHRLDDLRPERHEPVAVEHRVVGVDRLLEVAVGKRVDVHQLVLDDVEALLERR